jgi:hypothetical protein
MKAVQTGKSGSKPVILPQRSEEILRAVYFYRYVNALDMAHLLFSPGSLTHVRSILTDLAGGDDYQTNQYLYRFPLPHASSGNKERIFTLGSKGRDFLANEVGLPVDWYFRPGKVKHLSYGQVIHNLILTRFLVSAHAWCTKQTDFTLAQTRICYELSKMPNMVEVTKEGKTETLKVIPDAWLKFERLKDGKHNTFFPVLFEIDRGTEYQQKFKQHVRSRVEFIKRGGLYSNMFATEAVMIAYVTTGERPEYRDARRRAMCTWTQEVLTELHKENWASVFRFHSLCLDDIYNTALFDAPVWYRPDMQTPIPLFPA